MAAFIVVAIDPFVEIILRGGDVDRGVRALEGDRGQCGSKSPRWHAGERMNDSLNSGQQLKSAMWDAANTLRGSAVDRTDWKGYILPLLFFKRISDVWDEETAEAREIYGEADPSLFRRCTASCSLKAVTGTTSEKSLPTLVPRCKRPCRRSNGRIRTRSSASSARQTGQQGEVLRRVAERSDRRVLGDRARQHHRQHRRARRRLRVSSR